MTTHPPPVTESELWFLEGLVEQRHRIQHIPINVVPFQVGRSRESGLCLPYPSVSMIHAEIIVVGDKLFLRDLDSTNGTFLNGHRVEGTVPLGEGDLLQFASVEFQIRQHKARDYGGTVYDSSYKTSGILTRFQNLLAAKSIVPFFQPIVEFSGLSIACYEVLARSTSEGLETPAKMFSVAQKLGLASELSMVLRREGVQTGSALPNRAKLFINTHPSEGTDTGLLESMAQLRKSFPARPMTLEIHEAAITNLKEMHQLKKQLADLNICLAYDDFGAGQARLLDLVEVPPDYLKFDIKLVRDIHLNDQQQQMVASLVSMVRDFGIAAIAEGIECADEAAVCEELGFDYAQGYYFGKPASIDSAGILRHR